MNTEQSDLERLLQHSTAEIIEIHLPPKGAGYIGGYYRVYKADTMFTGGRAKSLVLTEGSCCVLCAMFHNTSASLKDLELFLAAKGIPLNGWQPIVYHADPRDGCATQPYVRSSYVKTRY